MINFDHKNGRPTKSQQISIERILRPYFENSISARVTADETDFNIKTVSNYFDQWKKEITESETDDFIIRCREEKARSLVSFEKQISSLVRDQNEIELIIEEAKKICNYSILEKFYKLKIKIIETKARFVSARINLITAPTADTVKELSHSMPYGYTPQVKNIQKF